MAWKQFAVGIGVLQLASPVIADDRVPTCSELVAGERDAVMFVLSTVYYWMDAARESGENDLVKGISISGKDEIVGWVAEECRAQPSAGVPAAFSRFRQVKYHLLVDRGRRSAQ